MSKMKKGVNVIIGFAEREHRRIVSSLFVMIHNSEASRRLTVSLPRLAQHAAALLFMTASLTAQLGDEFQVNSYTSGSQRYPTVAIDADGDFVVAWASPQDGSSFGVFAQRFDASGQPQGSEFRVNSFTLSHQRGPSVAMKADGDFVIVWESNDQDGSDSGIFAQRFDPFGNPQGSEFQVNSFTSNSQFKPSVAIDSDGDFVVAWSSDDQDGNGFGIFAQRFDPFGNPQGLEFQANTFTGSFQNEPSVAIDSDGDFVVVWHGDNQDGSDYGVFAQRFDPSGNPQGSELQVNSFISGDQYAASVAIDADGDFVVAWKSPQDGSSFGVFAQRFDASGQPQGSEFQVNAYTLGRQDFPSVAMKADGDFVIVWESNDQDGSSYGVFAKQSASPKKTRRRGVRRPGS